MKYERVKAEHLGMAATYAFATGTSAPRGTMSLKMNKQVPVLKRSDRNPIITGAEMELNRTFDVCMPEDGTVVALFSKYPPGVAHSYNKVLVIYENTHGILNSFELPKYFYHHTQFGFPYVDQPAKAKIRKGMSFRKGDVFLDSPNRRSDGWYGDGVLLNAVAISHPSTGDDGVGVCEDVLDRLELYVMDTNIVKIGADDIMLGIYGHNKVMPDLGELVRPDGLLMATRAYREDRALTSMSFKALSTVDPNNDRMYLVPTGSRVVDITVIHNPGQATWSMLGVHDQVADYWRYTRTYYETLVEYFRTEIGGHKPTDPPRKQMGMDLARVMREALTHLQPPSVNRLYRAAPLPEYLVSVTTLSTVKPFKGSKLVGKGSADKGVISAILKPEEMPVDKAGNRADIIFGTESPFGRMTMGAVRELTYNAAARDISRHIKRKHGLPATGSEAEYSKEIWRNYDALDKEMQHFYTMVGTEAISDYLSGTKEERIGEMIEVFSTDCPDLTLPIDREGSDIDRDRRFIEESYPGVLVNDVLSYVYRGERYYTKSKGIIGPRYVVALEQIAHDASASASSAHNVTGLVSHKSPTTDFGTSTITVANRIGNTETRMGPQQGAQTSGDRYRRRMDPPGTMFAELIARNGSNRDHKLAVRAILEAPEPGCIESLIDRNVHPFSKPRQMAIFEQLLLSQGAVYTPEGSQDEYEL